MKEGYEAYIKVRVLQDSSGGDGCAVNVEIPGAVMPIWVPIESLVAVPKLPQGEVMVSAAELDKLRHALDAAQSEKTCAMNEASYWRQRAHEMRGENLYLTGVVDAAKSLSDLTLPARDLDAYGC